MGTEIGIQQIVALYRERLESRKDTLLRDLKAREDDIIEEIVNREMESFRSFMLSSFKNMNALGNTTHAFLDIEKGLPTSPLNSDESKPTPSGADTNISEGTELKVIVDKVHPTPGSLLPGEKKYTTQHSGLGVTPSTRDSENDISEPPSSDAKVSSDFTDLENGDGSPYIPNATESV